ncbi:MAG: ParA family protein [Desulfobacterales bacterium]|nr:ParA family protein [Desulfobacterales bacterium]
MGQIITFYSFKGGTGRSMALANIAVLLARWNHNVLIVDWDIEAPGLEMFFKEFFPDVKSVKRKKGIVDLITEPGSTAEEKGDWQKLPIPIHISNIKKPVWFISAGKRDDDYYNNVRNLSVPEFYSERGGGEFIEYLRNEWKHTYDFILIDSRTGITDVGGICTVQLPDILALLFTPTEQSFDGILDIAKKAYKAQQKLSVDRFSLISIPVLSRIDQSEFKLMQTWYDHFSNELSDIYADWLPKSGDSSRQKILHREMLELTKLPYVPYFSYGEKLPVIEQRTSDPYGLGYYYENLAALIANNLENAYSLIKDRDAYIPERNKIMEHNISQKQEEFPIDKYLSSEDFFLQFTDKTLRNNACKAVELYLKDHEPVANTQLYSIHSVVQAFGLKGLQRLTENQKKKNTKKINQEFWEFIFQLFVAVPGPSFSIRSLIEDELIRQNIFQDEKMAGEKTQQKRIRKENKIMLEKMMNHALPIYFEHFKSHYFYKTSQGAGK